MYARVWRAKILPGKVEEYESAIKSILPAWRKMSGFNGMLVLRTGSGEMLEATVVSVWETADDLRSSENDTFRQGVQRVLSCCEPHASMREEYVVASEFGYSGSRDITTT